MFLENCLRWVNHYHMDLCPPDKTEARKILNKHLASAEEMVRILHDDNSYRSLFESDVTRIKQALKLIEKQE